MNNTRRLETTKKPYMLSTDSASELGAGAVGRTSPGQANATNDTLTTVVELLSRVQDEAGAWADEARYRHFGFDLAPRYVPMHRQADPHPSLL